MIAAMLAGLLACQSAPRTGSVSPRANATAGGTVEVWLTTGDQRVLFAPQPGVPLVGTAGASSAPIIQVNANQKYQEMIGFGAAMTDASAYLINNKMSGPDRERLLQDLFGRDSGIGFSFVRVPMGASDFSLRHYTYDDMPASATDSSLAHFSIDADRADKLPMLRRALAINPQLTVMASPWSPPAWMKTTNSLIKGTLRQEFYDSFSNYFVKFVRAYGAEGVRVHAITLQNEPNFEPENYPGMHLDPRVRAEVIGYHLGPLFARGGIKTVIWDWDHNWDLPQQPLNVLADSTARPYVQGVAWHCYGGEVRAQSTVHDRYPDKDAIFTECSGGDWSPKFDENLKWTVANLIIGAPRNWARGVLMWNLALDENHGPHLGGCNNCRGVVTIDTRTGQYKREVEYYAFAHASKFVRPGAHRIASESNDSSLASVAFANAERGSLVLIVLNSAIEPRAFIVRSGDKSFSYTLPPVAVATFLWE
jgi:glucosylceramidase